MSKINETNYPRRTQASYEDTDMLVIQESGGNTYTTRIEDLREDYEETLAPTLSALQDDINENLATIEGGSTASKIYAKGDYLVFGGKLCRVTSTSITAGATLTIGTNIELAPVGDELKTLSSDLTSLNDEIILSFPIFDSVTIGANISWLDFTFPVAAGDVFVWTMYAVSENPSGAITVAVSGSVGGSYLNGSRSHSQVSSPKYIFAKRATQAENIRISSFTNAAATFKGVAVTIRRKITLS